LLSSIFVKVYTLSLRLAFILQHHSDAIHPKLKRFGDSLHCLSENNYIDHRYLSIKMLQTATVCWVSEDLASLINFKEILEKGTLKNKRFAELMRT